MSATVRDMELTPDERSQMEELRPLVEAVFVQVLAALGAGSVREEIAQMTDEARQHADRSEELVRAAEQQMRAIERKLKRP